MYIHRKIEGVIKSHLTNFPAVAILGPRQSGKSTLAAYIMKDWSDSVYLDLEKPSDRVKLTDPELFFRMNRDKLICLDEIQRLPEIFSVMRSVIDENAGNGQFLILGSASKDLIRQSSESLAGRVVFVELPPFLLGEIMPGEKANDNILMKYWNRGGFPRSYLADGDDISFVWRQSFVNTFLERDVLQFEPKASPDMIMRLWKMCAHSQGQILNTSVLGASLGLSHTTVKKYLDLFEGVYMVRKLLPYAANLKKRIVKSPKIYIRDTGVLHVLLGLETFDDLMAHPAFGPSWETLVIENILGKYPDHTASFYRTSNGSEIDLILEKGNKRVAVECKVSTAPKLSAGFFHALKDLDIREAWVVTPFNDTYPLQENVRVTSLQEFLKKSN